MLQKTPKTIAMVFFLLIEAILYYFLLTSSGNVQSTTMYLSIILCFVFAALTCKKDTLLILAGLAFTLGADYCLVVAKPIEQLNGMLFFMGTQTMYAIYLQLKSKNKLLLIIRIALVVLAEAVAWFVLGDKLDPLAAVSMYYYANLIMNMVEAFMLFSQERLLGIGFVLFLLCDTVIGLQVAAGGYLPIEAGSILHTIIFPPFNLAWVFYLPSQVLIALSAGKKPQVN